MGDRRIFIVEFEKLCKVYMHPTNMHQKLRVRNEAGQAFNSEQGDLSRDPS